MFFGRRKGQAIRLLVAINALLLAGQASAHVRHHHSRYRTAAVVSAPRVIQCVAFAKWDAGIQISGNARDWWYNAAGVYQRGQRPESGSILSFQPSDRMPLGHVAVVTGISDSRTIVIEQSHWNSNGITRDVEVKDVSEDNDWSAVRVQLGRGAAFGSIYATHGFIYPRPDDSGQMTGRSQRVGYQDVVRPHMGRHVRRSLEVAEAPVHGQALDLTVPDIAADAPSRALR